MKNLKKLSKNEMRKVMGGVFPCGDGYCYEGMTCDDGVCQGEPVADICIGWPNAEKHTCYNCCISAYPGQFTNCAYLCGF